MESKRDIRNKLSTDSLLFLDKIKRLKIRETTPLIEIGL